MSLTHDPAGVASPPKASSATARAATAPQSLAAAIPVDGFTLERALSIGTQLAESLFQLHSGGRVHHGLCPAAADYDEATGVVSLGDPPSAPTPHQLGYVSPEQTGRIGRQVDQRSDLYSLGATLFHVVCGRPPFSAPDPLALVHAQLARTPPDPRAARPGLPDAVANLILRLLAKDPEERYQGIAGVLADLDECARQLRELGRIEDFPLGRHDVAVAKLRLSDRLYGRTEEVAQLEAALDRAASGSQQLLLIAGYSGSGKSVLAQHLSAPAAARGGFFLEGKFEQLGEPTPFAPIRQAFAGFFESMVRDVRRAEQVRRALEPALAQQGRVIIEVIPEAGLLLGEQPPVESLGPVEAQYRFTRVFQELLRVIATPETPLVLFLDDWQWIDPASLRLIEDLLGSNDLRGLLVIGAYRDNEVGPSHPVAAFVRRLRDKAIPFTEVCLPALREDDVAELLGDALGRTRNEVTAIARELHRRVEGNPFYLRAFLGDLCDSRTLVLDATGTWQWDMERIARSAPPQSVVRLVGARLSRLPAATREALKVASCLGSQFSRAMLAVASGADADALAGDLEPALEAGILSESAGRLRFLHDRVQEAAHELIDKGAEASLELSIGRRLAAAMELSQADDYLLQAVQHLNAGRAEITRECERHQLARLNLRAGVIARRSTAYASAARHASIGMELTGDAGWEVDYETTFELHALRAECEYLAGNFALAESLYPHALAYARSDLDRIRILNIRKDQYELQGRYADALAVLREGLALVGITFPTTEDALLAAMRREFAEMPGHLHGRRVADLVDAPALDDPLKVATLRMLMGMWPSCYVTGLQSLLGLVSVKIANFSLQHGNCEITSAAYVNYSFVAGYLTGDYEEAYEYAKVGIALAERYPERSVRAWCHFLVGCGTLIWRRPLREGLPHLERSVELGIASGNIACASYAASYVVTDSFMRGMPLEEARRLYDRHFPFLQRSNPAIHLFGQLGTTALRELASIDGFDEQAFLASYGAADFFMAVYLFGKVSACYLADRLDEGESFVDRALDLAPRLLAGTFKVPETMYYAALTLARQAETRDGTDRTGRVQRVAQIAERLRGLATASPHNIGHKLRLVEAELARLQGRSQEAIAAYEEAAEAAARAGFLQDEALALELCGRYLAASGARRLAAASLQDALDAWRRWGASSRMRLLEREFAHLLPAPVPGNPPPAAPGGAPLDWLSVTKASQAISREMDFGRLAERLVQILGENAGARRAILFLQEDGALIAVADGDLAADAPVRRPFLPLAEMDVPAAIIEDARRGDQAIVLADASREGPYANDAVVCRRRLRSILCTPVRYQGAQHGVLYLENDLGSGIFTPERRELLELLLAQVGISLQNARLYTELKENEQHLAGIFAQSLAGIAQTDLTGRFMNVNARYAQMVGRTPSQLLQMRMQEITHPDDLAANLAHFRPMIEGHGKPFTIEKRYLRPDGSHVWVNNSVSLIRSPEGEPRSVVAVSVDITDRKAALGTLERQNERLKLLWRAAGVLLTTDAPDTMLHGLFDSIKQSLALDAYFNFIVDPPAGGLRLHSCAGIDEATERSIQQLQLGEAICGTVAQQRRPIAAMRIQDSTEPMVQLVRGWGLRAYTCYPLLAGDRLLGTLSFASRQRDTFERDELEFLETISQYVTMAYERLRLIAEMREQDRRKDEFLATLSHELRNPLAPIRNGLQLFRLASADPNIVQTARGMMERQVEHLVRLVDDLLDMSRISRNKLELRRELVDLASIVRTAVETSRPVIDAGGHVLEVALPPAPLLVDADPVRLAQVFSNLLNNAAKYTPRGGRIELRAEASADRVTLSVRDNGVGIAPAQLARIFDMFVQLDRRTESGAGGLGIGLTLVKRLVEMHGGTVEARSGGDGKGSEFLVRLPIVLPQHAQSPAAASLQAAAQRRHRILVADDNEDAAESLAMMLRCLGHEVVTAHDGIEAVELAASALPDIALLDVGMPKMSGHEAALRIRAAAPDRKILLVAITGWGQEEDRRRSSEAGFDHHLVKPVDLPMLQAVIDAAFAPLQGAAAARATA